MAEAYEISLGGTKIRLNADGTAWLDAERVLIIADLHLEKGRALAATVPMPAYDTEDTLQRLMARVDADPPASLVLLGDSFHRGYMAAGLSADHRQQIDQLASRCRLIWITGNHDEDLPAMLPGVILPEIAISGVTLRHQAEAAVADVEISGHYHPKARLRTRARRVSGKCFIHDGRRLILPAFGAFTGGLSVADPAIRCWFEPPYGTGLEAAEILFCHGCQLYRYPYLAVDTD